MKAPNLHEAAKALRRIAKASLNKDDLFVDLNTRSHRRSICETCPENVNGQCQICTCVITLKTMSTTEACDLGKWPATVIIDETE